MKNQTLTAAVLVVLLGVVAVSLGKNISEYQLLSAERLTQVAQVASAGLHPADTTGDSRVDVSELNSYAFCWKSGCTTAKPPAPIPLDYLNSAAYIWKSGELYHYDTALSCPGCYAAGVGTTPSTTWVKSVGGTSYTYGLKMVKDSSGNTYIAGTFAGSSTFVNTTLVSKGLADIFIAKLDVAGVVQWARSYGSAQQEGVGEMAIDPGGNIYLANSFTGTINVGGGDLVAKKSTDAARNTTDVYLAKYDPQGNPLWSTTFGGTADEAVYGIAVDTTGSRVFMTGYQNIYTCTTFCSYSDSETYVSMFSVADGSFKWTKTFSHLGANIGQKLLVDKDNNLYVAGTFDNSWIDFGLGRLNVMRDTNPTWTDAYLAKFAPATDAAIGAPLWAKRIGGYTTERIITGEISADGSVVLGGYFTPGYRQTDLGGGPVTGTGSGADNFIAKYAGSDGIYVWGRVIQSDTATLRAIATDSANNVYATGYFSFDTPFYDNGATDRQVLKPVGTSDVFLAKYSSTGTSLWARSYGKAFSSPGANGMVVDGAGYPVIVGTYSGSMNFDGTTITSLGSSNTYVLKTQK